MSSNWRAALHSSETTVRYPREGHPAAQTSAEALCRRWELDAPVSASEPGSGVRVGLADEEWPLGPEAPSGTTPWGWIRITPEGEGELAASHPAMLTALPRLLDEGLTSEQEAYVPEGLLLQASFEWNRSHYDYILTQTARTARNFDPESYLQDLAESGFTHVEVNGLATPFPYEPGVPDEYYSQFYTYCAGLNQFVDTPLTQGIYPEPYLQANLNHLKELAALCRRYGLEPGLLCFEPRSLPEHFFEQYPTLRGARIDHPFRSHKPRYTLAQDHPVTRKHYRQLMQNLMEEVPELSYLSVWSNDSGAGFEHTSSLYIGRNGGPYMIREWRSHEDIAEVAGESVVRYLRLLQESAADVHPEFEVVLRMEHFKTEHDVIMDGMGDHLSVEVPSLLVRGYDLPYQHPRYPEQDGIAGSIHHVEFDATEQDKLSAYRQNGLEPSLNYSASPGFNMEPLLGIPFPRLLHRKLEALRDTGFRRVNALGGLLNTGQTPYWPNPEVIRTAQYNPEVPVDDVLHRAAERWAGEEHADQLVKKWDAVDEAVSYLPSVPLYSNFGFVWLRLWVRPFVPDIEAIPKADRRYYEQFMVSTPNNPNINDLGQDVLFELITEASGRRMAQQFDEHVLPRLDAILDGLEPLAKQTAGPARSVFVDLRDRVQAFRCWAATMRNTCAWVAGVHGYLEAETEAKKAQCRDTVREVVATEKANAEALLKLWETSTTEFMLISEVGETAFIYGENFGELLRTKIGLMERYGDREPYIDRDIIWRLEGGPNYEAASAMR